MFWFVVFNIIIVTVYSNDEMPLPFYREIYVTTPIMMGNDVIIAQTLLNRDNGVNPKISVDGQFGALSATVNE
jgi:hypothetical protein